MEDLTGRQFGPYQIVAPLGEGGMAAVYKAYQPAMERYIALKVLPRQLASDPQFVARFQREAKLLAQLQHPHILPVFDFGQAEGYTYLVMPFVSSGTLTEQLKGQPLPLPRIKQIAAQIGEALDYAHTRGLVHRDVKPSNVLLDERGNCLLTDFGLARMVETSVNLTTSGTVMGTPVYMSPEQGSGQPIDGRSDIYSLGVILYELATGRVPYKAETPIAVIFKHIHDPLPPARSVNPALPEALERVILKALAKGPEDRYQTAGELVKALQAALPDMLLEAAPQTEAFVASETVKQPLPAPGRAPATPKPLWQSVLIAALGWIIGVPFGVLFASVFMPFGGLVAGALGGASIGWGWRRIEPALARGQILTLAGIWAIVGALAVVTGPVLVIFLALGGALTAWRMRRVLPAMTRRDIALVGLGWGLTWLAGAAMFAIGTQLNPRWLSGVIVILAIVLTTGLSNWITFRQYRAAQARALAPLERAKPRAPGWVYVVAALAGLACLVAVALIARRPASQPASTDRAATSTSASLPAAAPTETRAAPTAAPSATPVPPSPTRPAPTATRVPPTRTPAPPSPTRVPPTRTRVPPTATADGSGAASKNWAVDFTRVFPPGFWSAGSHQYTLLSECPVVPDGNQSWTRSFDVSDSEPERPGDVFLRLTGLRYAGQVISAIHPSQSTVAQLTQIDITQAEAAAIASACRITISWDGGAAQPLEVGSPYQR